MARRGPDRRKLLQTLASSDCGVWQFLPGAAPTGLGLPPIALDSHEELPGPIYHQGSEEGRVA